MNTWACVATLKRIPESFLNLDEVFLVYGSIPRTLPDPCSPSMFSEPGVSNNKVVEVVVHSTNLSPLSFRVSNVSKVSNFEYQMDRRNIGLPTICMPRSVAYGDEPR